LNLAVGKRQLTAPNNYTSRRRYEMTMRGDAAALRDAQVTAPGWRPALRDDELTERSRQALLHLRHEPALA
jgi:hypothetical protein